MSYPHDFRKESTYWRDDLTEEILEDNIGKLDWYHVSKYSKLSDRFISKHLILINWKALSRNYNIHNDLIIKYKDRFDWRELSRRNLDNEILKKCKDMINWDIFNFQKNVDDDFLEMLMENIDWRKLSTCAVLTEEQIRKYQSKISWDFLSPLYEFSEEFILEFIEFLNLQALNLKNLSVDTIIKLKDKINWDKYIIDARLKDVEIIDECSDKFIWFRVELIEIKNINAQFVKRHKEKILEKYGTKKFHSQLQTRKFFENADIDFFRIFCRNINWTKHTCGYMYIVLEFIDPYQFLEEFHNYVDWDCISYKCIYFLENHTLFDKFDERLNWKIISSCPELSDELIERYEDKIRFRNLNSERKYKVSFLKKYVEKLDWDEVSKYLSSKSYLKSYELLKFKGNINWEILSKDPNISLEVLRSCKMYLNWELISHYIQSKVWNFEGIIEFKKKINWKTLMKRNISWKINLKIILECQDCFDKNVWDTISKYQELNEDILEKYDEKINWKLYFMSNPIFRNGIFSKDFLHKKLLRDSEERDGRLYNKYYDNKQIKYLIIRSLLFEKLDKDCVIHVMSFLDIKEFQKYF